MGDPCSYTITKKDVVFRFFCLKAPEIKSRSTQSLVREDAFTKIPF